MSPSLSIRSMLTCVFWLGEWKGMRVAGSMLVFVLVSKLNCRAKN